MFKSPILLLLTVMVLGFTSCCRHRPYPAYWHDQVIGVEVEKKDLKKQKR